LAGQKLIKMKLFFGLKQDTKKNTQIGPRGAKGIDFGSFSMTFWHPFFIIFLIQRNLLNCNKHGAKTSL
jgi:hypothetical protein